MKAQAQFEKQALAERHPHLQEPGAWNIFELQLLAFASLFEIKAMFRRVIIATVIQTFSQWTGINAVLYYAPSMFSQLGISSNTTSLLAPGVVGIVIFLATILAVLYVDRLGRKFTLTAGALVVATCHIIVAIILAVCEDDWPKHKAAGWAATAMIW